MRSLQKSHIYDIETFCIFCIEMYMEIDKKKPWRANDQKHDAAFLHGNTMEIVLAFALSYFPVLASQAWFAMMTVYIHSGGFIEKDLDHEVYDIKSLNSTPGTCKSQHLPCRAKKMSKMSGNQSEIEIECLLYVIGRNYVGTALRSIPDKGLLTPAFRNLHGLLTITHIDRDAIIREFDNRNFRRKYTIKRY